MTETEKMQGEVKDKMKPDMDSKKRMMYMSIKKKKIEVNLEGTTEMTSNLDMSNNRI